jgi:hypothetical protein
MRLSFLLRQHASCGTCAGSNRPEKAFLHVQGEDPFIISVWSSVDWRGRDGKVHDYRITDF